MVFDSDLGLWVEGSPIEYFLGHNGAHFFLSGKRHESVEKTTRESRQLKLRNRKKYRYQASISRHGICPFKFF